MVNFKRIIFIILISFLFSNIAFAACPTSGLVPCGTEDCPCTLCHLFVLIKRIVDFLTTHVAIPLVAIMAFVSAIFFIAAHGNPQWITRARQTLAAAVIGFIIVIGSWVIVNTIVVVATGNSAGEVFGRPWNTIQCGSGGGTSSLPGGENQTEGESLDPKEVAMAENMQESESKGNYEVYGVDSGRNYSVSKSRGNSFFAQISQIWGRSLYRTTPLIYYPDPQHVNYPTNLGVQNARFGSRFNLNFYFDPKRKKCWSSTMGSEMDAATSFIVATRLDSDKSVYRFPPSDQFYPEIATVVEVLPDRQRIYGYHPQNGQPTILTSIATISPFSPFKELNDSDKNFKMSIAPFFYNEIALYNNNYNNNNPNDDEIKGQVLIAIDYFKDYKEIDYRGGKIKVIYFQTGQDKGGLRALAIWDPKNIVTWGHGDGIFDAFKQDGKLPCKTGETGGKCQVGGAQWNAGGFAINFEFDKFNDKPSGTLKEEDKEKAIVFIYAGYNGGTVMKDEWGNNYKFYYTKSNLKFPDIESVITYAIKEFDFIIKKTTEFSNNIRGGDGRKLNLHAQWILSQALHSYFANTWLVYKSNNNVNNVDDIRYYVAEGDCKYLSTLDVAHETAIFEAEYIPWAVKKQLTEWKGYVLNDRFGKYLQHDMGIGTSIMKKQAYQYYDGGKMAAEENLNYALLSYRYWKKTGDKEFLKQNITLMNQLLDSVVKRDSNGNGIVDALNDRTTFDCCGKDYPLSIATENTYLGVKEFAAFIAASEMNRGVGNISKANQYLNYAKKIKTTLDNLYNSYWTWHDGKQRHYFVVSQSTDKEGWGAASPVVFDGLTYLSLNPPSNDGGLFKRFINQYVTPHEGALLFALVKSNDQWGYRNVSTPDLNNPGYDVCTIDVCYQKGWISKLMNTTTVLKYGKTKDWNIFAADVWTKSKNLLKNATMGYQDSWNMKTGVFDTLYLYPRGVSALGPKLIK